MVEERRGIEDWNKRRRMAVYSLAWENCTEHALLWACATSLQRVQMWRIVGLLFGCKMDIDFVVVP